MTPPQGASPFPPNARQRLGLFGGLAVVGVALGFATVDGPQILLPSLAWLLTTIGIVGFGRILTRGIVTAFAGPAYLWLAEATIIITALAFIHGIAAALVGLALPVSISRGLVLLMRLSWLALAAVCIRGFYRQLPLRRRRQQSPDV